jgi:CheY-like chemotaxis protein
MIRRIFSEQTSEPVPKALTETDVSVSCPVSSKILLAEDNKVNQALARKMLTNMGNTVEVAGDGEIAVKMTKENKYDLIFMDMQMPNLNGIDATKKIREFDPLIPIVAMTANVFESDRIACIEAGMNDFIPKPIKREELRKKIIKYCDSRYAGLSSEKEIRVLIVDDSPFTRKVIKKNVLKYFPAWTVLTASDGIEASALLGSFSPDIVITDMVMPNMNGEALIKFIKTSKRYAGVKVIVITSVSKESPSLKRIISHGTIPVETKPCSFRTLKKHLESSLSA